MKTGIAVVLSFVFLCVVFAVTAGAKHEAEAPSYGFLDVNMGITLFNDTHLGNGTSGKSCNSCHPDGKGLEAAGEKKEFHIMGKTHNSLEEAINACIVNALKGTAIDPHGKDMKALVAYIKSLKKTE
jgi:cytochrome c